MPNKTRRHADLQPLADVMRAFRKEAGHTQESFAYGARQDRGFIGAVERAPSGTSVTGS